MKKSVLSLILVFAMLLSCVPNVFAAGSSSGWTANGCTIMLTASRISVPAPETREATPVVLLAAVLLLSFCGLVVLLLLRKKDKDQE